MKAKRTITAENVIAIIGLFFALLLIACIGIRYKSGIVIKQQLPFWLPVSIVITVGGTIIAVASVFPINILKRVPKMIGMIFGQSKFNPYKYIEEMVRYCRIVSLKGILALEKSADECEDPFMKSALMLIVDINDKEKVQQMLDDAIDFSYERHEANILFWLKCSAIVSGIGIIGTIAGFINIFVTLDHTNSYSTAITDTGIVIALFTAIYCVLISIALFNVIASKLKALHDKELLCMQLVQEGTISIILRLSPQTVRERLENVLLSAKL